MWLKNISKLSRQHRTSVNERLLVMRRNSCASRPLDQELRRQDWPATGNQNVGLRNQKHVRQRQAKPLNSNAQITIPHIIVCYVVKHMKRRGFNAKILNCRHTTHVQICPIQSRPITGTTSVIIVMY